MIFEMLLPHPVLHFTVDQVRLIKRFTTKVTILYDGDQAGIKAAMRGVDIILGQGLTVHILMLPEDHDPDSFIRETGTEKFKNILKVTDRTSYYLRQKSR